MTHDEYVYLTSEIHQLQSLLTDIPASNVINRWSLEQRLQSARTAIANFLPAALAKKARLTFRGRPVFGSYGVAAEFGSKAAQFFAEAFTAVVAGISENLHFMGPIPDKEKNQLLITGTALGSFGFEFELPVRSGDDTGQGEMFPKSNDPEQAMEKLEALFQTAAEGSDDELAELVDEIHPRAVKKASEFLSYVAEQEAWCGLQFEERVFRFSGAVQMQSSAKRLAPENILESEETFLGEFQGVLPTGRTFEFKVRDDGSVLRGKVGLQIDDPDLLNRERLHQLVSVRFHVIKVGEGRPRYTLRAMEDVEMMVAQTDPPHVPQ